MPEHKPGGDHSGHRQRMKDRLLSGGLDGFSDHEIVEILLFYALPYRNTNELAHTLVAHFGGWTQVLDADYADLVAVPGVTPHVATLLTLVGQTVRRYHRDLAGQVMHLHDDRSLAAHVIPWFLGQRDESVVLVSLDNKRKHLNTTRVFVGSVNSAQFNIRVAVQQALRDNATQVVLAHNHPNGFAFPSEADIATTHRIREVLAPLDIRLLDHIIVAEGDALCLSLLSDSRWIFEEDALPPLSLVADVQ
ncbi:MAG: hypothetical protein IKU51_00770 [Clostridia bacterium]|nr:hypothetical protein [Clostridia bacterium]